jgi:dTDP-4-dehydrorhamnose 3,5-epimerase
MNILDTPLSGLKIIEPDVYSDARGYFFESFHSGKWANHGIDCLFVQDNESFSTYGVIRGLHYQLAPYAQAKLVRVISGAVFDVAVDIRKGSPNFGQWFGIELSSENKRQLFIPHGFAHGFSVLSPTAIFTYKCDGYYNKESERAIRFDDPELAIDWQIPGDKGLVSAKDLQALPFHSADINFNYQAK